MVGMFLEDTLPVSSPHTLRFYVSDNSEGGIPTDVRFLEPVLGEVFFIGDGLTGTGTGGVQGFRVPPTATHLYLGYVDSCNPGTPSLPSCYFDNGGSVTAFFRLYTIK